MAFIQQHFTTGAWFFVFVSFLIPSQSPESAGLSLQDCSLFSQLLKSQGAYQMHVAVIHTAWALGQEVYIYLAGQESLIQTIPESPVWLLN